MTPSEIIDLLNHLQVKYRFMEHPPANTVEEIDRLGLPDANAIVKNLFLRDDKKRNYYLLVARKDKTINLKELSGLLGSRPLSFASEEDLFRYLHLKKGSVTPFGILNDAERAVHVLIDSDVMAFHVVAVHPNENTATVWLSPSDLKTILENHGSTVDVLKI